ncbi:MAG: ABC transporter substrate-binding protein [Synergistaceae bacterium]|nr:ABC transporter substrate-binding protein [Synergistaceae bacterium]
MTLLKIAAFFCCIIRLMNDSPIEVVRELIKIYGSSLLEDPDRMGHLLEDRCAEYKREIFVLSFAMREILKDGSLPRPEAFMENRERMEARFRENLGFSNQVASWAAGAIENFLTWSAETAENSDGRVEARRGFLPYVGNVMAKHPRTVLFRKKTLRNGLLLVSIIAVFLGLFIRITESRYSVSDEHGVLFFAHLSGPGAGFGHVRLKAAQLAADQINASGGVKGRPVRIKAHDIPLSPADAASAADVLMRDRSNVAAVSVCGDAVNVAIAGVADAGEMPLIVPESRSEAVTMATEDSPRLYVFRLNYDNRYKGKMAAYFLTRGLRRAKPALIYEAYDDNSYEMRAGFMEAIGDYGGVIACEEVWTRIGGLDKASVGEIIISDADSAVIMNDTADIAHVTSALRGFGYSGVIVGADFNESLNAAGGAGLDDSWWVVPASPDDPQLQSFQSSYRDKYNENISRDDFFGTLFAYDSVRWVADALFRAPGFQGEALRHAFMSTRNLVLSHATLTIDPRTHGPWNKAAALLYRSDLGAKFQKRIRPQ